MLDNQLFKRLSAPATPARTEADIQSDIKTLLMFGDFDRDEARLEEQIGDGTRRRIDIAISVTVIEAKRTLSTEDAKALPLLHPWPPTYTPSMARPTAPPHRAYG